MISFLHLRKLYFFEHVIFSFQWWLLICIIIVLWVTWIFLVDKNRLPIILLVGFTTSFFAIIMDDIGLALSLWAYPYQIIYFLNPLNSIDMAIIPVCYMLLYQYFRTWKHFMMVLVLLSLFAVFIAEPLFVKLDMYVLLKWQYWYSGPIYILIGIFVKGLFDEIDKRTST